MINLGVPVKTTLFTVLHFLVDGLCALCIFTFLYNDSYQDCLILFFIYNGLAFLTQPLIGLWIDKYPHPHLFLLFAVESILLAFISKDIAILSACLLGLGNAFFHISGGKYVIEHTHNDVFHLGLFVSTGAIGLFLGQAFASIEMIYGFLMALFIICFLLFLSKEEGLSKPQTHLKESPVSCSYVLILLLLVVAIRSFVGKITVMEMDVNKWMLLGVAIATTLGKVVGGLAAKYIGVFKTISWSMVISIVMLSLFTKDYPCILIGIFFFNFSMPITLYLSNRLLPSHRGFSFGLLAAALIPGYLLGMIEYNIVLSKWLIAILSFTTAIIVNISYRSIRNGLR